MSAAPPLVDGKGVVLGAVEHRVHANEARDVLCALVRRCEETATEAAMWDETAKARGTAVRLWEYRHRYAQVEEQ